MNARSEKEDDQQERINKKVRSDNPSQDAPINDIEMAAELQKGPSFRDKLMGNFAVLIHDWILNEEDSLVEEEIDPDCLKIRLSKEKVRL